MANREGDDLHSEEWETQTKWSFMQRGKAHCLGHPGFESDEFGWGICQAGFYGGVHLLP